MHLIENAGQLWHRFNSVRMSLLAAVLSAADAGWQAYVTGQPRLMSLATFAISLGAAVARLVAQPASAMAERLPPPKGALAALALAACAAATTITHPFEGEVKRTYPDVVYGWKLPTACRGHTGLAPDGVPLAAGQTFTDAECDEMERADLTKTFDGLRQCMGDSSLAKLNPNELGAFLSLGYNLGDGAVCRSSIPGKVRAGQITAACATISEFYKAGGKDCRVAASNCAGIPRRRAAERALCER